MYVDDDVHVDLGPYVVQYVLPRGLDHPDTLIFRIERPLGGEACPTLQPELVRRLFPRRMRK
jgi:hypothetical protein